MARRVFFSFHYLADNWRVSQIRNIHMLDENRPVSDNEWEQIKKGGENAIRRWIDGQMFGKSCAVVLVGSSTANRKWINYEIARAWSDGKGVFGIRIHGLKDRLGNTSSAGQNPFDYVAHPGSGRRLSEYVKLHDPTSFWGSSETFSNIKEHIGDWVEAAIKQRENT
jgi:MTH538 TIR-like domain (DUF1863)